MLHLSLSRIRPDQEERLRDWMAELHTRADEVRMTLTREGVHQETAFLIRAQDGPILVFAVEADDPDRALDVFRTSELPVDSEHRAVMSEAVAGPADVVLLYEVRA
jgi:hypothetical protein